MGSFEPAPPTEGEALVVKKIQERLAARLNAIVVFYGPSGSGKSWSCLRLAQLVYPKFSTALIVFSLEEYLHLLNTEGAIPAGAVVVWEESGIGAAARNAMTSINKVFSMVLESVRFRNHALFLNLPALRQLDINARRMSHFAVETLGVNIRGECSAKFFIVRNVSWNEEPLLEFPREKRPGRATLVVERVHIGPPTSDLSDAYETMRREKVSARYNDWEEGLIMKRETDDLNARDKWEKAKTKKRGPGRPPKDPKHRTHNRDPPDQPENGYSP